MFGALLILFLGAAPPMSVETQNPYLRQAIEKINALEEQESLPLLEQALHWPKNTLSDLAQTHLWRGLAYAGLSEETQARQSFDAAVRLDSTLALPLGISPRIRQWWDETRLKIQLETQVPPPAPPALAFVPPPPAPSPQTSLRRPIGQVVLGLGAAALVTGFVLGQLANGHHAAAQQEPAVGNAVQLQRTAVTEAHLSNLSWAFGGVLALTGGALWVF